MKYAIPSAILVSLFALSACGTNSQRYSSNSPGTVTIQAAPADTNPNSPQKSGHVGAGTGDADGTPAAK